MPGSCVGAWLLDNVKSSSVFEVFSVNFLGISNVALCHAARRFVLKGYIAVEPNIADNNVALYCEVCFFSFRCKSHSMPFQILA